MTGLIIFLILLLLVVIIIQISKVSDLAAKIRGVEEVEQRRNDLTAVWLVIFMVVFLIFCVASAIYYKNSMLGYGPHTSASEHGVELDSLFNVTLGFTGIVFIVTQIFLFWYAYKYRRKEGRVAKFFAHSTMLEAIWTIIPAVVMFYLVIQGLIAWNKVMPDVSPEDDYMEIEATGYQFAWDIRYPGPDGKLGEKNYKLIGGLNNLGQDWNDTKNLDDFQPAELYFPVGKKVRVRITAKDVLHNFYLPHFRVKMDAIPGLPTYFIFTPTKTTQEYREELSKYPEWQVPAYEDEPDGPLRWEAFDYELACAELCGTGHYSMRRIVKVVSQEEYDEWLSKQSSYYMQNIRNTDDDPWKGQLLDIEIAARATEFKAAIDGAINAEDEAGKTLNLNNVQFKTGSSILTDDSKYELDNVKEALDSNPNLRIELSGHTDNTGDSSSNRTLSRERADAVKNYLVNLGVNEDRMTTVGYGDSRPIDSNDTEEGRMNNRRTELKIISQ